MSTPAHAAARAVLAKVAERGGVKNVAHTEAHGLVREAMGVADTSPATWQATRAALDAIAGGTTDPAKVAATIAAVHVKPPGTYPAQLYGAGDPTDKPSQWVSPERRRALLAASRLGRAVLDHKPESR